MHYPPDLPIAQRRDEIVSAIQAYQTIVLTGETGSGKTTQIPKMCLDAGLGKSGRIACTQPRRVAALSVAKRVAEELKVSFGKEVGAKIRFTDQTSKQTRVKFMTDGMLLTEIHGDPLMRDYEAVIIDEAHERSLNIDFLLGYLNQLRARRPDLKIIITSATIDTEKFSAAFDDAPIIEVSGRVYPVDIVYAPLDELLEDSGDFTYIEGIAESAKRIQDEFGTGDILAFLPTEKDIREAMDLLDSRFGRRMEIIPCFGRLSNADQQRIFQSSPRRKLILATNIAETSLTIPGIRFVIDTGLARISRYNPRGRTKRLPIAKISQSSANQRSGRCGRVADGICIRLYSEKDYLSREIYSVPEIQRSNLADVILRMTASKLGDVETFPFIDPPSPAAISAGYQLLQELGALTVSDATRGPRLTELGRKLSRLPADPTVGRMLLEANRHGVTHEVLVIAAALSIQDPRERPMDKESAARQAHDQFNHEYSDFLALLNIWEALHENFERLSQARLRKFCKKNFLNYLRIREWRDIYQQLERSLPKPGGLGSTQSASPQPTQNPEPKTQNLDRDSAPYHAIHACLLTGLLANVGQREETNLYRCSANRKPLVFPGSSLFIRQPRDKKTGKRKDSGTETGKKKRKSPEWILSAEIVETNRLYARTVASIDPSWILDVGRHIISYSYSDPEFLPDQGRVVTRESIRIHGLEIQNKQVSYLKVDPAKATEIFIREALLNEEYAAPANWTFLKPNRRLISRIQNAQTVISVAHWMGVEEAAYTFYQKRLEHIASIADLNRFLKSSRSALGSENEPDPHGLLMSEADLTASEEASFDLSLFPESVELGNSALPIEYQYKHGHEKDGVTLKLPYSKAKSINNALLDWLIPGHLEPKIHSLLKALPKHVRQRLIPLADSAKKIASELRPTGTSLVASLQTYLQASYSIETYASDWDESAIPDHLRARVEVHDKNGKTIAEARDAQTLHSRLEAKQAELSATKANDTSSLWKKARENYEREINSISDLRDAPSPTTSNNRIRIGNPNGLPLYAYPALRSNTGGTSSASPGSSIHLSLFRSEAEATAANASGIAALLEHELRRELAWIRTDLKDVQRVGPAAVPFRPIAALKEDVYEHIRQTLRTHNLRTLDADAILAVREKAYELSKGLLYRVVDQLKLILEKRQALIVQPTVAKHFSADIDRILPPDFLRHTPNHILPRIPVYLEGIQRRADTLGQNPSRDAQRQRQLDHYRNRLAQAGTTLRATPQATQISWMIEEFAISLFAQHLGTAHPISPKKLDQALSEIGATPVELPQNSKPNIQKPSTKGTSDRPTQADLNSLKNLFR
ncbi:ATP-dependent RNA helicase HrpA [Pelagicoccus sp. SDUM812002]|nr:ATP-dependent RNA helicase HrpA [Pelagicoccus sp. SDUM812002]